MQHQPGPAKATSCPSVPNQRPHKASNPRNLVEHGNRDPAASTARRARRLPPPLRPLADRRPFRTQPAALYPDSRSPGFRPTRRSRASHVLIRPARPAGRRGHCRGATVALDGIGGDIGRTAMSLPGVGASPSATPLAPSPSSHDRPSARPSCDRDALRGCAGPPGPCNR